ncbi:hypothetical protein RA210_U10345 [Rubrivivax sp. A210]|nr:hypothetical protein RA210_U10345 [Rubrivivax sp. A210]
MPLQAGFRSGLNFFAPAASITGLGRGSRSLEWKVVNRRPASAVRLSARSQARADFFSGLDASSAIAP